MQKKILLNLMIISLCGIVLTTVALFAIQTGMANNAAERIFSARLEDVAERIRHNEPQIDELLRGIPVGDTGYVFSVSADTGLIYSHPNQQLIGASLPEPLQDGGFMAIDGRKVMYGAKVIGEHVVAAVIPTAELYAQRSFYVIVFAGLMIIVFGAFCIAVNAYIKKTVISGITDTVLTLDRIASGNLNVTADIRSSTEFERLSDGINNMLQNIKAKMAEIAALAGTRERLGAIAAIADAGIVVKDKDDVVQDWNIGAENILGYMPEEIVGRTTKFCTPEEKHSGIDEINERLSKGEHIAHVEVMRKHKDGRLIDCSASYTPIFDDSGAFTGSVSIFHDISDRKQIEQALRDAVFVAEEASRAKSLFLANMSHEIRTPMNGVIGFAELALDDGRISDYARDCLNKIKVSADGLLEIINDILDLSKIEAGKIEIEKIPFNMHDVFKQCEAISGARAEEKGIALYFYAEPYIGQRLIGDPTRIRQVLLNLLSNAIKFTNKGYIKLISTVEEMYNKSIIIHFEVKDSGIGMYPEQIKKIFEPYMQADSSTTRKYGGTGLGLAISKSMVELMGGELKVESTPGVGSRFSFSLPFETLDEPAGVQEQEDEPCEIKKPDLSGDVLVCEDNAINQQVMQGHLSKLGLNVTIVGNGELGIEAVKERNARGKPFDLIFMDIHMPVMDGLEASQELISMGVKTPIIALTANAMAKDRGTYLAYGMADYLAKPFKTQVLWACLLNHLTPLSEADIASADTPPSIPADMSGIENTVINRRLGMEQSGGGEELYNRLLAHFAKDGTSAYEKINAAVSEGDIALARSLTHTLKGVSGTLGATELQKAAVALEDSLSEGETESAKDRLLALGSALDAVLVELAPFVEECETAQEQTGVLDKDEALALVGKLIPMLENYQSGCLQLLPQIKEILSPIGEKCNLLIAQIEDCDFELAAETAESIRQLIAGDLTLV